MEIMFGIGFQCFRFDAFLIHVDDVEDTLCRNGYQISSNGFVGRIRNFPLEDICLEVEIGIVFGFQRNFSGR